MSNQHPTVLTEQEEYFRSSLTEELMRLLPRHITPSIRDYAKNNRSMRTGVSFERDTDAELSSSPIIYIDPYIEPYRRGKLTIEDIAVIVSEQYMRYADYPLPDPDYLSSFDTARNRLAFKVVNTVRNNEFLLSVPHIDILDLSLVFYIMAKTDHGEAFACTVTHGIAEEWGTDTGILYSEASSHMPRLLPPELKPLRSMIGDITGGEYIDGEQSINELYVLTHTLGSYGAAAIFYPGAALSCREALGGDIYVLPSSVHELILLRAEAAPEPERLSAIVSDINKTLVSDEEFLSDNIYRVSGGSGALEYAYTTFSSPSR